jgi:hypothetical protein
LKKDDGRQESPQASSDKLSEPPKPQGNDLGGILENAKPASDLERYAGTIALTEDPLVFQERMRREW